MKRSLLKYLACPDCGADFELTGSGEEGSLNCQGGGHAFPVVRGIPRFVSSESYAESFGLQWNKFAQTQRDSANGTRIFHTRFQNITGWNLESLKGDVVLDAGCGPGSFVEVVAPHAKEVIAVDLSAAVEACHKNDGHKPNVHVIQADLFKLPFKKAAFDRVYSIGVLQHTPDPLSALRSICQYVKPEGQLAFWCYDFRLSYFVSPRFLMRSLVSRLSPKAAEDFLSAYTPKALKLRRWLRKIPALGRYVEKGVFVIDYSRTYPELSREQLEEWAYMDTYDSLATRYEIRVPVRTYKKVLEGEKFQVTDLRKDGTGPAIVAKKL